MANQYFGLINEETELDEIELEKHELVIREMLELVVADKNYDEGTGQSEFDYYLNILQRIDPLKTFVDDYQCLFEEATYTLNCQLTKCEAIVHYIADHDCIKLKDDDLVHASSSCESLAFKLIKMGLNVHHVMEGRLLCTALQGAASMGFINLVKYLLNCKVDVNALSGSSARALHYACIESGSSAIVKLIIETEGASLLFDREPWDDTPLGWAMISENFDAASTILKSKLANNLEFEGLRELFIILCSRELVTVNSMEIDLFKLFWEKLVQSFILSTQSNSRDQSILSAYLNNIVFRSEHWSNALKVILTSTIASKLLEEFAAIETEGIFSVLMTKFHEVGVGKDDRMELIKLLLELGVKSNLMDLAKALLYFKCETEFDYLSFALRNDCLLNCEKNQLEYVASVFCGLGDQLDFTKLENLDRPFYNFVTEYFTPVSLIDSLTDHEDINIRVPNIPSLAELSRNAARRFVRKNTETHSPKHFKDFVNSLKLPVKHINFIMLKIPLKKF